jgi:hypothetical protein
MALASHSASLGPLCLSPTLQNHNNNPIGPEYLEETTPQDPTTLDAYSISKLLEFFRLLDRWDREQASST